MNAGQSSLRTTLLEGLVESAQRNLNAGNDDIALFEIARVLGAVPNRDSPRSGRGSAGSSKVASRG